MLLKVHTSNFRVIGFTSEVELLDLVSLGKKHGLLVMEDLGSGSLLDLSAYGLPREPTVGEVVKAGVDVVTFSGDKLLGDPQAGLIIGKKNIIELVKKNPLNRALRIDKFTLAGLEAVLRLYYDDQQALAAVPTLKMMTMPLTRISSRATRLVRRIKKELAPRCEVTTMAVNSRVGGGAMPEHGMASRAVVLAPKDRSVNELEQQLRDDPLPVIGRIEDNYLLLDMRTVDDGEIAQLCTCLLAAFAEKI